MVVKGYSYPWIYDSISQEDQEKLRQRKVLFIDRNVAEEVLSPEDCLNVLEQAYKEEGLYSAVNRPIRFK